MAVNPTPPKSSLASSAAVYVPVSSANGSKSSLSQSRESSSSFSLSCKMAAAPAAAVPTSNPESPNPSKRLSSSSSLPRSVWAGASTKRSSKSSLKGTRAGASVVAGVSVVSPNRSSLASSVSAVNSLSQSSSSSSSIRGVSTTAVFSSVNQSRSSPLESDSPSPIQSGSPVLSLVPRISPASVSASSSGSISSSQFVDPSALSATRVDVAAAACDENQSEPLSSSSSLLISTSLNQSVLGTAVSDSSSIMRSAPFPRSTMICLNRGGAPLTENARPTAVSPSKVASLICVNACSCSK